MVVTWTDSLPPQIAAGGGGVDARDITELECQQIAHRRSETLVLLRAIADKGRDGQAVVAEGPGDQQLDDCRGEQKPEDGLADPRQYAPALLGDGWGR